MNWIKAHYERALLVLFGVAALAVGGYLVTQAQSFGARFADDQRAQGSKQDALVSADVDTALKMLGNFEPWIRPKIGAHKTVPLFASTPFVVMADKEEPFDMLADNAPKLREPIENWWLVENDLDYTSIDVLTQDPDKDGFTNGDEWNGKTNPNSSLSKPGAETKLYFVERIVDPLTIRLSNFDASTNSCYFAFITKDDKGAEVRVSETIQVGALSKRYAPDRFKLVGVKKEVVKKFGADTQVDVASLEDTATGETIRVEQGKPEEHPSYRAKLLYGLDNETFIVKKGDYVEIKRPPMSIQLKELHDDHIVVEYPNQAKGGEPTSKKIALAPAPK